MNGRVGRRFIALSEYLRAVVLRYASQALVEIVPVYGVDVARFAPGCDRPAARAARNLPASARIIFSSSRVAPEKDTKTLLAAFAALVREGRDVYLLHRSGAHREFKAHADRAGVGARVIATDAADPRGDLALDYAAADVCVQASREEGLGFSVLEALACGTPVVATGVGGLRETVRHGETGWSVAPEDPAALASALGEALDNPDEAHRRAAAGAAMVRERYASDAAFDRLVALLAPARAS
jgi:glycosyltransferase involved in cell wall biosynthesis